MELTYSDNFHTDKPGPFDGPIVPVIVFGGSGGVRGGFTTEFSRSFIETRVSKMYTNTIL